MIALLFGREVGRQRVIQLRDDLGARARAHAQQFQYQLLEHTVVQPLGPHVLPVSASVANPPLDRQATKPQDDKMLSTQERPHL